MRRGNDNGMLFTSDLNSTERDPEKCVKSGTFIGINLGADYCAEHEWGIKKIDQVLARDPITHKINKIVEEPKKRPHYVSFGPGLIFVESKDGEVAALIFQDSWWDEPFKEPMTALQLKKAVSDKFSDLRLRSGWGKHPAETLATAWGDSSFGILVEGKENVELLRKLHEAFKVGDIAIWLGGGGVFQNAGLCIAIYSALPKEVIQGWKEHYEDRQKLLAASEGTGIEKKLIAAGKKWFALSPSWSQSIKSTKDGEIKTKYPVIYFLNPYDQHLHNFGWFTVEQLEEWAEDKGPIMMTEEQKAKHRR